MDRQTRGALHFHSEGRELESATEEEILLSDESDSAQEGSGIPKRRLLMAAVGSGILAACALVAFVASPSAASVEPAADAPTSHVVNLRTLLESNDYHNAAADALVQLDAGRNAGLNAEELRSSIAKLSRSHAAKPEVARHLESRPMGARKREALLHAVRHSTDPSVQEFGKRIGEIVANSHQHSELTNGVRQASSSFKIRELRDTLFPSLAPLDRNRDLDIAVDPEKMRLTKRFDDHWRMEIDMGSRRLEEVTTPAPTAPPTLAPGGATPAPTAPPTMVTAATTTTTTTTTTMLITVATTTVAKSGFDKIFNEATQHKLEEALEILADLVLEADNVLSNLDMVGGTFDNNGKVDKGIPYWSKSMLGGASSMLGIGKCFLEADDDLEGEDTGVFSKGNFMICAMQYAESVADFLSAADNVLGFSGGFGSGSNVGATNPATQATTTYWAYER